MPFFTAVAFSCSLGSPQAVPRPRSPAKPQVSGWQLLAAFCPDPHPPIPISDHYCSKSLCVPTAGNVSQEHLKHLKPSPSEPAGGEPSCARSQFPSSSSMCKVFMTATLPAQGSRSPRDPLGAGVRQTINNCVCHGAWTARTAL